MPLCGRTPPQYVSAPKGSVFQCQYSMRRAPRATSSQASCRHCPSYGDSFIEEKPIEPALVSVTRNGACFEEYMRSASCVTAHGPRTTQPIRPVARGSEFGLAERVLHLVVGVARRHVEGPAELHVLDAGLLVGDAGRDEAAAAGDFAHDAGLPADELGDELGLEAPPGQVVLRLEVALRTPQLAPPRQPVRPVDEAPLLVQPVYGAVAMAQPVDEPLEDVVVVEESRARFVVDLVADDGRVVPVSSDHLPDHPLGVEPVRGVGEIHLLPSSPPDAVPGRRLGRDLRVAPGQPHRDGVGRRAEDHADVPLVGGVEDRLEPVQLEPSVLRFPGRPDRLADPDDREAGLRHQVEVGLEVRAAAGTRRSTQRRSGCGPSAVGAPVPEVGEADRALRTA